MTSVRSALSTINDKISKMKFIKIKQERHLEKLTEFRKHNFREIDLLIENYHNQYSEQLVAMKKELTDNLNNIVSKVKKIDDLYHFDEIDQEYKNILQNNKSSLNHFRKQIRESKKYLDDKSENIKNLKIEFNTLEEIVNNKKQKINSDIDNFPEWNNLLNTFSELKAFKEFPLHDFQAPRSFVYKDFLNPYEENDIVIFLTRKTTGLSRFFLSDDRKLHNFIKNNPDFLNKFINIKNEIISFHEENKKYKILTNIIKNDEKNIDEIKKEINDCEKQINKLSDQDRLLNTIKTQFIKKEEDNIKQKQKDFIEGFVKKDIEFNKIYISISMAEKEMKNMKKSIDNTKKTINSLEDIERKLSRTRDKSARLRRWNDSDFDNIDTFHNQMNRYNYDDNSIINNILTIESIELLMDGVANITDIPETKINDFVQSSIFDNGVNIDNGSFDGPSPSFDTPSFDTPSFDTPSFSPSDFSSPSFDSPSFDSGSSSSFDSGSSSFDSGSSSFDSGW